jgi:4-amino-4-deoxy-L-arabinose transferase-like glycosyltransferase
MSRHLISVGLLGLSAFVLRLGLAFFLGINAISPPGSDQYDYTRYASNLAQGKGYIGPEPGHSGDVPSAYLPPGTPFFYAAIDTLFGEHYAVLRVAQCVLSTCSVLVLYGLTRAVAGNPTAAVAAVLFAVYPHSLFFSYELLTETLYVFLLLVFAWICQVWLARTPTWGAAIAAGITLGATCLTRPTILFFLPFYVLWVALIFRSRKGRGLALVVLVIAACVVAPWTIRVSRLYDRFVLVAPTTWTVMIQGNNRIVATDPKYAGYCIWYTDIPEYKHKFDGLNLVEREDVAKALTLEWFRANTDQIGRLVLNKAVRFWSPFLKQQNKLNRLAMLLSWGPVLVLFVPAFCVTLVRGVQERSPMLWMHFFIVAVFLQALIYFGLPRYRYPMEPFCIVFAAMAINYVRNSIAWRPAIAWSHP